MTVWIILFWVVGVGLLVAVAVWRGLKNGPTVFESTTIDIDSVLREQLIAAERAAQAADQTQAELASLRSEIERLSRKFESDDREGDPSKKVESDRPLVPKAFFKAFKGPFRDLDIAPDHTIDHHILGEVKPLARTAVGEVIALQRQLEALIRDSGNLTVVDVAGRFLYDPQRPKAPLIDGPLIVKHPI
jgi:hypothetical protein